MSKFKGLTSIHTSHKHIRFNWFKHSRLWVSGAAPKRMQTEKCVLLWFPDDEQTEQATTPVNGWGAALTQVWLLWIFPLTFGHGPQGVLSFALCPVWAGMWCVCAITEAELQADTVLEEGGMYSEMAPRWVFEWQSISRKGRRKEGVDSNLPTDQYDPCLSLAGFMEGLLLKEIHWPLSAYFPPKPNTAITLCHSALGLWPKRYHSCSLSMTYC